MDDGHFLDRREFLALAAALAAIARPRAADARLLGTVPLEGPRPAPPFERLLGDELDARLFTNLSALSPATLVIPNDRFYVRTAAPLSLQAPASWRIAIGGDVEHPVALDLDTLNAESTAIGARLMECAGNSDPSNFGLMSVAEWDGVPLARILDRAAPRLRTRVLVTGVDATQSRAGTSIPGASWIFSRDDLERTGAFLATRMNKTPLPRDHGAPVRLVVPGWYGCASIKWVNRIDFVGDQEAATSQMREFALRTHQNGVPTLAREYDPPAIDPAAMPVRVEKWASNQHLFYRVIGIQWGGPKPAGDLLIRFRHAQPWIKVEDCPRPDVATGWTLWSHTWRPAEPGRYDIVLKAADPSIRTRRLDLYFYTRSVTISDAAAG